MNAESGLKWLLRFIAATTTFALAAAVLPQSWLAYMVHLAEPETPMTLLVTYSTRMLCLLYAFVGLLCWIFSNNPERYRPLIWIIGIGSLLVPAPGLALLFSLAPPAGRDSFFWIVFIDLAEGAAQGILLVILLILTRPSRSLRTQEEDQRESRSRSL
jgi:hypothetical protein